MSGPGGIAQPDPMRTRPPRIKVIFGGEDRPDTQRIFHVSSGVPPALLITGGRDGLVEPGNSSRLAARLHAAGNAATVLTYRRTGHFIIIAAFAPRLRFAVPVLRDVDTFINKILLQRDAAI